MNNCFFPADILLPNENKVTDLSAYSTIACDQFTKDSKYWEELDNLVSDKVSTLRLTLPEIYLDKNADERIKAINSKMSEYISNDVFTTYKDCYILTVRKTAYVPKRIGLIGKIDLEQYEYSSKSNALIRSTEGTIEERIPPRLKIRKDAPIEFPHIMILFDDEKREITEKLYNNRQNYKKLYDFELNMKGGHVEGYLIPSKEVENAFDDLLNEKRLTKKYGFNDKFLFAVGDGNHSLATAKAHWNNVKSSGVDTFNHPARFALVEAVNIYDEGIYFEPIYRYVLNVDKEKFIEGLKAVSGNFAYFDGKETKNVKCEVSLPNSIANVDKYVKEYLLKFGGEVDYIHGLKEIKNMVQSNDNSVAVLFDKMDKGDLFKFVSKSGSLPRKTFSMGEGIEKRYYLEGRKITKC